MKPVFYKMWAALLCVCLLTGLFPTAFAQNTAQANNITADTAFSGTGYNSFYFLTDGNTKEYATSGANPAITLENPDGMGSLYLLFDLEYAEYTITNNDTGDSITAGQHSFLHEYVDLKAAFGALPESVTLTFSGTVRLSELSVFSEGTPPEHVQVWGAPLDGKADLVLFATHGDDDQLFFAGLLPYYAAEIGCGVQVVYMTDHRNLTNARTHEMLNGLWAVGVTAYPVFGDFADFLIEDLQGTYDEYARLGISQDELLSFVVEQVRRFRPQVAVGHDLNGEYRHGMHMVYSDLLVKALDTAANPSAYPSSAEKYGTWSIPKLYLHLYAENPIELNYDAPLDSFDGMTAFEVTQKLGYPCHESQQYTWFTKWINWVDRKVNGTPITKASQISTYSPCKFGLYRSLVGEDMKKNDFLENIVTYAEQERLEQERLEQERLEQERLEQERLEQERLEQERLEQERLEQERLEQERLEKERLEKERLEQERLEKELRKQNELTIAVVCLVLLIIALIAVITTPRILHKRRRKKRAARRRENIR